MASAQMLVSVAAHITGYPRSRVNQFARKMIDTEIWPKAVGRRVPSIPEPEILSLIACVAFAERFNDVPKIIDAFISLQLKNGVPEKKSMFSNGTYLLECFATVLSAHDLASATLKLSMTTNGPTATLDLEFRTKDVKPISLQFWTTNSWGGYCKRTFEISSEGMQAMSNLLMRAEEDQVEVL